MMVSQSPVAQQWREAISQIFSRKWALARCSSLFRRNHGLFSSSVRARLEEIDRALMDPSVVSSMKKLRALTKERVNISSPMVFLWRDLERCREEIAAMQAGWLSDPQK